VKHVLKKREKKQARKYLNRSVPGFSRKRVRRLQQNTARETGRQTSAVYAVKHLAFLDSFPLFVRIDPSILSDNSSNIQADNEVIGTNFALETRLDSPQEPILGIRIDL